MSVSFTETQQFRRLVQFLEDVRDYAALTDDEDLGGLVLDCQTDLAESLGVSIE